MMINLIPPDLKKNYGYARRNSALMRIVTALSAGILGLAVISAAGVLYLQQTANTFAAQAAADEKQLASQNQAQVEKTVSDISNNLKLAVQVLSQEVLFSKLLNQLAVITPNRARLSDVNIAQFGGGLDISAETVDYAAAAQMQVNMTDPNNKIFAKADIVSITCSSDAASLKSGYPCKASYRALFRSDNPFLFINNGKKAGN